MGRGQREVPADMVGSWTCPGLAGPPIVVIVRCVHLAGLGGGFAARLADAATGNRQDCALVSAAQQAAKVRPA